MSSNRWILPVPLFLVAVLAVSCGGGEPSSSTSSGGPPGVSMPRATPLPTVTGTTEMAVDAIPGEATDATRTMTGTAPFDVDIVIAKAEPAYQGYQYMLLWDPAVLALDGQVDLKPDDLSMCATPATADERVAAGCIRAAGPTTFGGAVNRVTLHCVGDGTSQLHLLSSAEEDSFTTTLLPDGRAIATALVDASVTCEGVEPAGQ